MCVKTLLYVLHPSTSVINLPRNFYNFLQHFLHVLFLLTLPNSIYYV